MFQCRRWRLDCVKVLKINEIDDFWEQKKTEWSQTLLLQLGTCSIWVIIHFKQQNLFWFWLTSFCDAKKHQYTHSLTRTYTHTHKMHRPELIKPLGKVEEFVKDPLKSH